VKSNRTATKSLGRPNSFSAVTPLQLLLMLGRWGRKERGLKDCSTMRKRLVWMLQKLLAPCKGRWTQKRVKS